MDSSSTLPPSEGQQPLPVAYGKLFVPEGRSSAHKILTWQVAKGVPPKSKETTEKADNIKDTLKQLLAPPRIPPKPVKQGFVAQRVRKYQERIGEQPVVQKSTTRFVETYPAVAGSSQVPAEERNKVIEEIKETELTFHSNMNTWINFLGQLRDRKILTEEQYQEVVIPFQAAIAASKKFIKSIVVKEGQPQRIVEAFASEELIKEYFKAISQTLPNFWSHIELFNQLGKNSEFQRLLQDERLQKLKPADFLTMPMQRGGRLEMLSQDLLKKTPNQHPDYQQLWQGSPIVRKWQIWVNEEKRKVDNLEAANKLLVEIQKKLGFLRKRKLTDFLKKAAPESLEEQRLTLKTVLETYKQELPKIKWKKDREELETLLSELTRLLGEGDQAILERMANLEKKFPPLFVQSFRLRKRAKQKAEEGVEEAKTSQQQTADIMQRIENSEFLKLVEALSPQNRKLIENEIQQMRILNYGLEEIERQKMVEELRRQ